MGCQGIPLATRGYIFCPSTTVVECDTKCYIPLNLQIKTDVFKLNLQELDPIKLNTMIDFNKINLLKLSDLKLNTKLSTDFKLNLKKCEE